MKTPAAWPQGVTAVLLLGVALLARVTFWTWVCVFAAGVMAQRAFHVWWVMRNAERRLREAEERQQAALAECNCGTINGHPHEPDCCWWDRNCK